MGLSVCELIADLHQAYSAFLAADQILALFSCFVRVESFQLGAGDEEDIVGKDLLDIVIADRHVFLSLSKNSVDVLNDGLKGFDRAVLSGDDLLPVPLVHVDGVDIVCVFVAADGHHVGVKPLSNAETVFAEGVALPFRKGVNDLCHLPGFLYVKRYRALHSVEVVVKSRLGADKEGGGDAAQVQPLCEEILKEVLYGLDGDLGLMKIQR